ncbi:hypothetical protein D3C74_308870 [compost metagenome]
MRVARGWWRGGLVGHRRAGTDHDGVAVAVGRVFVPAGGFLGLVATSASAIAVEDGALASAGVLLDVVYFLHDAVAERGAAVPVADRDELLELFREDPGFGVHGDQVLVAGCGVEAGEFGAHVELFDQLRGGFGVHLVEGQAVGDLVPADPFAHALGGDEAVAFQIGWFAFAGEQGPVGHDYCDLQGDGHFGGFADHHVAEEQIGADLGAGARVAFFAQGFRFFVEVAFEAHALQQGVFAVDDDAAVLVVDFQGEVALLFDGFLLDGVGVGDVGQGEFSDCFLDLGGAHGFEHVRVLGVEVVEFGAALGFEVLERGEDGLGLGFGEFAAGAGGGEVRGVFEEDAAIDQVVAHAVR